MVIDFLLELLKGIGLFFVHPLLYIAIIVIVTIGIMRVRRERRDFHVRVYDFIDDLIRPIFPSVVVGLIITAVTIGVGIVFTPQDIVVIAIAYLLLLATTQVRLLTAGSVFLVAIALTYLLAGQVWNIPFLGMVAFQVEITHFFNMALFFSLLLIAEGCLIQVNGVKKTSPRLFTSKRGKYVGGHEGKRIWILPIFFLVPEGLLPSFTYWPLLPLPMSDSYSILLVPFLIGFQQLVTSSLPLQPIKKMGRNVVYLGIAVLLFAIASYFYPFLLVVTVTIALVGRIVFELVHYVKEKGKVSFFTPRKEGMVVLGVLPQSPAEKMKINVGDIIVKVNGIEVNSPQQFYLALQKSSAFCKLDIMDENGEIRFAQTAVYDDEHHQIGVLLVKEEYELQDSVV